MTYTPIWVTESGLEAIIQVDLHSGTHPNLNECLDMAEEVEVGMEARALGSHSSPILFKFDVTPGTTLIRDSVGWVMAGSPAMTRGIAVVPPYTPILSVVSGTLSRNKASLISATSWEVLAEGPGVSTDFIILKRRSKTGKYNGYALYFYSSKAPYGGYQTLRATIMYGHNVDTEILKEYANLKTAVKVIESRTRSAEPVGIAAYTMGDTQSFINTDFSSQMDTITRRIEEIERLYLPNKMISVAVM